MTMQLFVRGNCTMIAAPVQCDVDGIPKWSHSARVPPMEETSTISGITPKRLLCEAIPWFRTGNALGSETGPPACIFHTTLKQFRELQSERREHEHRAMAEAAKVMKLHQTQQIPFNPAELGFVFSLSEIQDWRSRQERIQAARDLAAREFNTRFFPRTALEPAAEPEVA